MTIDTSPEAVDWVAHSLELKFPEGTAARYLDGEAAALLRELSRQLQAEKARADKAEADLNETFVDDTGLAWSRPTAEAYYLACRLRERLKTQLSTIAVKAAKAREVVEEQANDTGLWFIAQYATEAYLQTALRNLHAAVEGTDALGNAIVEKVRV